MNYPNGEIPVSSLWMKNFSSCLECLTSARRTAEYALFFHPVGITLDLVRLPKINGYSWYFPVLWNGFFSLSMKHLSYPALWKVFFSLSMKQKECVSLDVYLFTLMIHKWDSSASSTWFWPLSLWVFVSFHSFQFSNFNEYDVLGDYVLFQGAVLLISFSANLTGDSCTNKTSKVSNGELLYV